MRLLCLAAIALAASGSSQKAPRELTFESKQGKIVFKHAAHVKRAGNKCHACHDSLVPRAAAPFKSGKACTPCHQQGGRAFQMKGNCGRCHADSK